MCFGLSYFLYDIYAMFIVFKEAASLDKNEKQGSFQVSFVHIQGAFCIEAIHVYVYKLTLFWTFMNLTRSIT